MPDAAPATTEDVLQLYRARLAEEEASIAAQRKRRRFVARIVLAGMMVAALLSRRSLQETLSLSLMLLEFPALVGLIWYSLRVGAHISHAERMQSFYLRSMVRVDGSQPQSGRTGTDGTDDLRQPGHLYQNDLDLLGADSLFGLLATVRTGPGERGLANFLLQPASHAQTLLRQQAVRELVPQTGLRERIALLGASRFQAISASFFDDWLADPPPTFHPLFRIALAITSLIATGLLLSGILRVRPWGAVLPNLAAALAVQGLICLVLRSRVMPLLQGSVRLQQHIRLISEGLALLGSSTFASPLLTQLQAAARQPAGAVKALSKLGSSLAIVEQRPKEYFLLFSLLSAAGTQAAISIAKWKHTHAAAMASWLAAWAEFEALNAIAGYAFEHPEDTWPDLLPATHTPTFEAAALGHPLLAASVTNDVALHHDARFFLISGSNMAGKSTLLRSIGINAVLAYAGAPVRARSLRLTPLTLGASLALTDSLAEGKSKFLAEVQRLSAIVEAGRHAPVLFLVDEIFSGTNSHDRRTAAGAVLDALLAHGAIGALSTHDLALTELATAANAGINVHMASPDPADPLAFDYKLKPGVNTSSNALAILRMMGLDA